MGSYDSRNYIDGVDQRTIPEQQRAEKADKVAFENELKRRAESGRKRRAEKGRNNPPKPFITPMTISGQSTITVRKSGGIGNKEVNPIYRNQNN
jgi:hypothetical protein